MVWLHEIAFIIRIWLIYSTVIFIFSHVHVVFSFFDNEACLC